VILHLLRTPTRPIQTGIPHLMTTQGCFS
jgi:hypothetical protein